MERIVFTDTFLTSLASAHICFVIDRWNLLKLTTQSTLLELCPHCLHCTMHTLTQPIQGKRVWWIESRWTLASFSTDKWRNNVYYYVHEYEYEYEIPINDAFHLSNKVTSQSMHFTNSFNCSVSVSVSVSLNRNKSYRTEFTVTNNRLHFGFELRANAKEWVVILKSFVRSCADCNFQCLCYSFRIVLWFSLTSNLVGHHITPFITSICLPTWRLFIEH